MRHDDGTIALARMQAALKTDFLRKFPRIPNLGEFRFRSNSAYSEDYT
jgi:hypothetical protein